MSYQDPSYAHAFRPPSRAPWVLLVMTLGGAGYGGYRLFQERQRARADAETATAKATAVEAEKEAAKKELSEKIEKLEAERTELETAKQELTRNVEAKTGELAQLKGTYDKLEEKMKEEIAHGDIRLSQSGGKLRVDLVDKILFDSGEALISKRGEGVLSRVGAVLAAIDDKQIQVSGHTDKTPISEKLTAQFPTNWELSAARATNVVRFLEEKAGVPPQRLIASGYGEHHPIAANKTAAGRARNRRIEILLTPSLDPKVIARAKLQAAAGGDADGGGGEGDPDKGGEASEAKDDDAAKTDAPRRKSSAAAKDRAASRSKDAAKIAAKDKDHKPKKR